MSVFPNTGSLIERGLDGVEGRTTTALSTQIVIKVNNVAVGALQNLTVTQNRPLYRVNEIGVDGNIEIVPQSSTTFELAATRIVFDQLRLPEAFSRSFRFINAQRIPFDIEIFDINNSSPDAAVDAAASGVVVHKYINCWFTRYETPYQAENYIITETAGIWAETGHVSSPQDQGIEFLRSDDGLRQTDTSGIENTVNVGNRRGAVDAGGLVNAIFGS